MSKKKRPIPKESTTTVGNITPRSYDLRSPNSVLGDWCISLISIVLTALVLIVFGQTIHHEFLNYDDNTLVAENVHILKGLSFESLRWALTVGFTACDPTLAFRGAVDNDYWRPVSLISHMMDVQFFGLRPGWHHAVNLLIHAMASVGLFLTLLTMTGMLWRSAIVAALFAIHPLHVESVAWVAERKDVLSGFFFMLTLWAYAHYVREESHEPRPFAWGAYLLILLFCSLAMMSKPMVVTLPFVLLLLDYWPFERIGKTAWLRLLIEKIPVFAMSLAVAWLTTRGSGGLSLGLMDKLPLSWRLGNAATSYALYLKQTFWPTGLAVFYHHPGKNLTMLTLGFSMALLLITSGWVAWHWKKRYLTVGWLWYIGMLVPVIGIIQSGDQARADRYTYLPLIGIFIMVVWFAVDWSHGGGRKERRRFLLSGFAFAILIMLAVVSYRQVSFWHNSRTLWMHALACTSDNEVAQNNLGTIIEQARRPEEALPYFREAVRVDPNYTYARNNLGLCLVKMGRRGEAIEEFRAALRSNPYYVDAYGNLGCALMEEGKPEEALEYLKKGLALNPTSPQLHYNMGMDLIVLGRGTESACEFEEVIRRDSEFQDVQHQVGKALLQLGRRKEAIDHLERANLADPSSTQVMNDLAWALATVPEENLRNGEKALELALEANKATGESNPYILDTLAAAYAETGNYPEALKSARRAQELARKAGISELADNLNEEIESYHEKQAGRDKNKF